MITVFACEEARARLSSFLTCCPKAASICNVSNWAIKVCRQKKMLVRKVFLPNMWTRFRVSHTLSEENQIQPRQQQPERGDFFMALISSISLSLSLTAYLDTCPQWHRRRGKTHVWPIIFLRSVRKACRWATREWKLCWKCQEVD